MKQNDRIYARESGSDSIILSCKTETFPACILNQSINGYLIKVPGQGKHFESSSEGDEISFTYASPEQHTNYIHWKAKIVRCEIEENDALLALEML